MNTRAPGGDCTWIAAFILLCGAYLVGAGLVDRVAPLGVGGGVMLLTGVGLWLKCSWARWFGSVLICGCALWFAWDLALDGFDLYRTVGLLACGFFAAEIWLRFKPAA